MTMTASNSESRKRHESQPLAVLREADRLNLNERVLRALRKVYPTSDWLDGLALKDALEDEELLRG